VREAGVVRAVEYVQARVRALQGLTVEDALQSAFRTARGGTRRYGQADLKWDLKHGYLTVGGKWGGEVMCGGEEMEFEMSDSEYADDTGLLFCDRRSVERMAPRVNEHFARWGMQVHEKAPGDKKVKTLVLFCAAPPMSYINPHTYDNANLSDIRLPSGNVIPVVDKAKYLGSMISRDGTDTVDVVARVAAATKAFGSLSRLVFRSDQVSAAAKREAYVAIVLAILIYGSESWCLTAEMWGRLRRFHHQCARAMCGVSMWHTREYRISTVSVLKVLKLRSIETYIRRRQLQWAGHVARMPPTRLPRMFLTSWCGHPRPQRRPDFTYGESLAAALEYAGIEQEGWMEAAQDRAGWKQRANGIREPDVGHIDVHAVLRRRAGV